MHPIFHQILTFINLYKKGTSKPYSFLVIQFLTGEEMSDRASYVYLFSFGKSFWKKLKIKAKSKSNHLKSMRKNQLNLMNLLKRILKSTVHHLMDKKKKFNKLVEEKSYEFQNLKEKINPNNLIYNYKTEGKKSERS